MEKLKLNLDRIRTRERIYLGSENIKPIVGLRQYGTKFVDKGYAPLSSYILSGIDRTGMMCTEADVSFEECTEAEISDMPQGAANNPFTDPRVSKFDVVELRGYAALESIRQATKTETGSAPESSDSETGSGASSEAPAKNEKE